MWVLPSLVSKQVVATREAIDVSAAGHGTVEHGLGRRVLVVGSLVALTVLWVEEALATDGALVRPLRAPEVGLLVTST